MTDKILDEYKPLAFYKKHGTEKQTGFSKFEVEGEYYFCRYSDGNICMLSQAYKSIAGRDNGIVSIRTNEKIKGRYKFTHRDGGKHGFSLRAGNHQEIAISPEYKTLAAAEHVVGRLTGKVKAKKTAAKKATAKPAAKTATPKKTAPKKPVPKVKPAKAAATAAFTSTDGRIENYKPLAFYEKHGGMGDGFNQFDEDGAYYFNYAQDGDVVLISESYTSARGRDNGVESVKKNMPLAARYKHHTHKNGKYYFDINAANHQEIATSRWYDSEGAAQDGAKRLRGEMPLKSALTAGAVGAAGLAAGAAVAARAANVEQDYKPLAFYQRQTEGREHGIETFTGDDGKHYFAYFENDKIALISEGYPTKAARDTGVASVEKNIGIEKRYEYRGPLKNGKYDYRLKAGNHKEIARSVWYGSAAAAAAGAAYLMGTRKRAAAVPVVAPKPSAPIAKVAAAPLAAAAVAASAAARPEPVAAPVAAKPEPVAVAAAAEPAAAAYDGGGGIWGWLKWLLLALIALLAMFFLFKNCVGGETTAKVAPVATESGAAAVTPMVSCWNGTEAATLSACPAKITCWNGDEVTAQSACPVEPAPAAVEPEPAPTFTCWDDSEVEDLANCPPVPEVEFAVVETPSATPTRNNSVTSSAGFLSGAGATAGIFLAGDTPVTVRRLGTFPEFGDSRGLSGSAFYDKLNARYATNNFDRNYLDYLAKELGYTGWSEVTAADFTETSIANGTSGVLGFGEYHGYQYVTYDMEDLSHLEAFQFASRNGKQVYFMKRCGNYFFPT
ncbi:DUF1508 domain-containing protein [Litorimonas sp. WD9-15]|uniref:DUF1508 domain-containing protein n=1 Tax=Litorimonas sp. WD9-15 TaxID=3418716 RepID=UPI003D083710